jgi:hypothetical protein
MGNKQVCGASMQGSEQEDPYRRLLARWACVGAAKEKQIY